jgi:hypothetical protein
MAKLRHPETDCFNSPEFDRISAAFYQTVVPYRHADASTWQPVFFASTSPVRGSCIRVGRIPPQ